MKNYLKFPLPTGIEWFRLPERVKLLEDNIGTTVGPQGPEGPQGITGPQGPQGVEGPQGIQGEVGAALTVLGSYPNLTAFLAGAGASPGDPGEAWLLEADGSLMIWNTATNAWEDVGDLQGPQGIQGIQGIQGEQGIQGIQGIQGVAGPGVATGGTAGQVLVKVNGSNYNTTWADASTIGAPTTVRWSPVFEATGLTFTGSGLTYPSYNSYYVKFGQLVSFNIVIELSTVTNFGTGQFKTELPFLPIPTAANHFSAWGWVNPALPADELNGHVQMVADHLPNSLSLDLHWLKETTATPKPLIESLLVQGTPVTFTTASRIYINGTYIAQ